MEGKVKWFRTDLGYGFILSGDKEIFMHHTQILQNGPKRLNPGDIVDFELKIINNKPTAHNITLIKKGL